MSDIVERLRDLAAIDNCQASREAAAEIERLRAALEGAIEAMTRGAGSLSEYANILSHEPYAADLLDQAAETARAALEDK